MSPHLHVRLHSWNTTAAEAGRTQGPSRGQSMILSIPALNSAKQQEHFVGRRVVADPC